MSIMAGSEETSGKASSPIKFDARLNKDGDVEHTFVYNGRKYVGTWHGESAAGLSEWLTSYVQNAACCFFCGRLMMPGEETTTAEMPDRITEKRGHRLGCIGPYAEGDDGVYLMDGTFHSSRYGRCITDPETGLFVTSLEDAEVVPTEKADAV